MIRIKSRQLRESESNVESMKGVQLERKSPSVNPESFRGQGIFPDALCPRSDGSWQNHGHSRPNRKIAAHHVRVLARPHPGYGWPYAGAKGN